MPLIRTDRHSAADLATWGRLERADRVHAQSLRFARRVEQAHVALDAFVAAGRCYAGVSWGKDSTVLAHMVATRAPEVPLVWVRVEPIKNPECALVRDAFRAQYPIRYDEIETHCTRDAAGEWHASGTLERGFVASRERYGRRYVSGVRAAESGPRKVSVRRNGLVGDATCRPLGWWDAADVWAYLWLHALPIHPAYGYSAGGTWPRDHLRVASIGGQRGTGAGRGEWERRYYPVALAIPHT